MRRRAPIDGWTILLLVGLPVALIRLAGSPLPDTPPTSADLTRWVAEPLTHETITATLTALTWLMWLTLLTLAALDVGRRVTQRRRMPRLHLPRPAQMLTATLVGTAAASSAANAATAITVGPQVTLDNTPADADTVRTVLAPTQPASASGRPAAHRNYTDPTAEPAVYQIQTGDHDPRQHATARRLTPPPSSDTAQAAARTPAVAVAALAPVCAATAEPVTGIGAHPAVTTPARPAVTYTTVAGRGDSGPPAWARSAPGDVYPVVEGDNLWDIAEAKLGDPFRWRDIYALNRDKPQANGYALRDPDEIHIGWWLALPARDHATTPPPATTKPAPHGDADERPEQAPAPPPHTAPASPPPTATPATPPPTSTTPAIPTSPPAAVASPTPEPAKATPDGAPAPEDEQRTGVTLPSQAWVSLGLAATIAAVAAMLRLQRRRRARLTFPVPVSTAPQPASVPPFLVRIDAVGNRHLASGPKQRPAGSAVPAPVGVDADGAEVSLFDLPGTGVTLHGDGAVPAARALLAAALSTGAADTVDARPVVVTTADLLARLLPDGAPAVGLDPDGTAFDGERLIVLADTADAVTHAEEEMIGRRRLLDTFDADTITGLNARTDHAEMQPPYVLLIEATDRHAARLFAVAAHRAALDLHPVIIGALDGFPTVDVARDGAATGAQPSPVARLSTIGAADLASVLGMLTDVLARPEAGTDVDDPPAELARPAASTELAEPVPAQPDDAPALVQLRVLGPVTVATDAGPVATGMRSGSYTALALLAAHPVGRTLDQLAAALHPDTDKDTAVKRVRTDITTTRRVLRAATGYDEPMFIVYDQTTGRYRLDPDTVGVDLWQMLTAVEKANTADDDMAALAALRQAAELYGGDFADGHDHTWAVEYATTYRYQILSVYARIAEILEADQPDQAVAALEHAVELDPVNEELYQRIMRIHGRQQRPDAVRRTLRRLQERLADLGDAEPSQATRRVAERQLRPAAPISGGRP